MNHWYERPPRLMRDWILLIVMAGLALAAVLYLPALANGVGKVLSLFSPFLLAIALAYVLDIPTRWFAQKIFRGRRIPAIALSYLVFFGVLAALIGLVVPQLVESVGTFAAALPGYLDNAELLLERAQEEYGIDTSAILVWLDNSGKNIESLLSEMAPSLAGAAMGAAGQLMDFFVALAASIYLLAGKQNLLTGARAALRAALPPRTAGSVLSVFTLANRTFCGYIGGQLLDAVLVGIETFVLMLLLRIPFAPLIAVIVGVTNIIPVLGPYLGAVPGAVLLLLSGNPIKMAEFLIIILVVQQVDGNFIAPRILGDATGLSGLWVLVAIVVGGGLMGIPGMVIGVPLLGVVAALAKSFVGAGLSARGIDADGNRQLSGKKSEKSL
ncbi:MAG: AI-2E family transporter [Gemmiger sp.]|uniref:AI-2E family transporter n=1 Tax=Gemmiger sp. TaxID=2049027 RepID=UPI002E769E7A|nr:AI-2E family transporter [Gemmiger sp.]MEE0799987.1 AI-2E family transporter [Gemmiger sp.]